MSQKAPTFQQEEFVKHYLTGLTATEAAKRAGYAATNAAVAGHRLLKHNEYVRRRIADAQEQQQRETGWTMDRAMADLDGVIKLATEAKQFNAVVRANEVKAKMAGFLKDASVNIGLQLDIGAAITEARTRVNDWRVADSVADAAPRLANSQEKGK